MLVGASAIFEPSTASFATQHTDSYSMFLFFTPYLECGRREHGGQSPIKGKCRYSMGGRGGGGGGVQISRNLIKINSKHILGADKNTQIEETGFLWHNMRQIHKMATDKNCNFCQLRRSFASLCIYLYWPDPDRVIHCFKKLDVFRNNYWVLHGHCDRLQNCFDTYFCD